MLPPILPRPIMPSCINPPTAGGRTETGASLQCTTQCLDALPGADYRLSLTVPIEIADMELWFRALLVALISGFLQATPCRAEALSQKPFVIGVSNAQSGPSGSLGKQLVRGSQAYFDWLNERGGIYGRQVKLQVEDDRYEPEPAVQDR